MNSVLERSWYSKHRLTRFLMPLAGLFGVVSRWRCKWLKKSWRKNRLPVPVIVVGNISVGGTGKTPLLIALADNLKQQGYRPGVISRGYGGKADSYPLMVDAKTDPAKAGDEPVLIAQQTGCPLVVDPDRLAAARYLLTHSDCNIVISDDGLQHYRLPRDIEVVVIDGERGFGNGKLLPAGPLREPTSRLASVDFVVVNGEASEALRPLLSQLPTHRMSLEPSTHLRALTGQKSVKIRDWPFTRRHVRAIAGIGNPSRFVTTLTELGFKVELVPFVDHHKYQASDLEFTDGKALMMTAKDAVKCHPFARDDQWVLDVTAQLPDAWYQLLQTKIDALAGRQSAASKEKGREQ